MPGKTRTMNLLNISTLLSSTVLAFNNPPTQLHLHHRSFFHRHSNKPFHANKISHTCLRVLKLDTSDQILSLWVIAFSTSHIGLSAVRTQLISSIGDTIDNIQLVGNEQWKLPPWWPGDSAGGNRIFPDRLTAGRQVYRAFYTAVSFITLGSAFAAYLTSSALHDDDAAFGRSETIYNACLFTASLGFGAAIASLFNASPLGLMPSFEGGETIGTDREIIARLQRDDTLKFTVRGLTRITRHPLILPVVPWGIATAYLAGNRPCDYVLFGGLSLYAIAGCYAQDLRVIREEGSVGTVFQTEVRLEENEEREQLRGFFAETSFVPFKAVLDGRQSLTSIISETPWLQFFVGTIFGMFIEIQLLEILKNSST